MEEERERDEREVLKGRESEWERKEGERRGGRVNAKN